MTGIRRIVALILVAGVFILDGYDINAMALAVPRLQEPLGLAPDQFGWVFSALLIGLGAGSALIGPLGDRLGRRPLIVFGCLAIACATPDCGPAHMVLELSSATPVKLTLFSHRRGLPPQGAALLKARPAWTVPSQSGDATVLAATIAVPAR